MNASVPVPHDILDTGSLAEERIDHRCLGWYERGLAQEAE